MLVLLPLGGGALAATSSGADGDIAFVNGGEHPAESAAGRAVVTGAVDPSWSPDGKKLAFSVARSGPTVQTCTVTSGSCGAPAVLSTTGIEPVWSPDGSKIAYVKGGDVWTMTPTGGTQTQLTSTGTRSGPTWSPTTTGKIAFASGGTIFTISTGGGAANPLTITGPSGALSHPAWSPDGATIAFQASDGTHIQIWVVAATGGTAAR